jgi:hypothetical protein
MPKTLAQRFFWMWITLSGEVKVSLQSATMLQEAMKTPTQHNSSRQKG